MRMMPGSTYFLSEIRIKYKLKALKQLTGNYKPIG